MTNIDELSKKIAAAKTERAESPENLKRSEENIDREMSFGMRVGVELFAGVLVGAIIGYFFDEVFDTLPIFLIIFLLLGTAAGFWNIYKAFYKDGTLK